MDPRLFLQMEAIESEDLDYRSSIKNTYKPNRENSDSPWLSIFILYILDFYRLSKNTGEL